MNTIASHPPEATAAVRRAIAKHSFCTLSTSSETNCPHGVGVLYAAVDGILFVSTQRSSKKARNIAANSRVAVCIPVRRYPMAPPFLVQFGAVAQILAADDPAFIQLTWSRALKKITSHGELDDPDTCFLRIVPNRRVFTYGFGVPLRKLLRDPIHASRTFDLGRS